MIDTSDVKRLSVYRLSFIFLVLVFEFQKPIIVSNLALSSLRLKDASPRSAANVEGRRQLTIVSHLAGRPTGAIWMRVGGTNYIVARGWRHTCV